MRTAALVVALALIWVLLWGAATFANIAAGLLVGLVLVLVVPGLRPRSSGGPPVLRPVAAVRLVGHVLVDTVRSNIVLTREVLSPRSRIRTGVVGVELPGCSDELLTLVTDLLALAPGTMPIELTSDPTILYVHVLHLHDVEQVERDVLTLTDRAVRAFGSAEAVAAQDAFLRAPGGTP